MVRGIRVRGWMMRFQVSGPPELIRLGYDAGFGERNAQGFGMVRIAHWDEGARWATQEPYHARDSA
jgi:CRISPR-associated endoribonuclease Cas6